MIAVAAGMVIRNGKIMVCRRKPGGDMGLKWEFPGGKLEDGETPEQALARELREELGIGVEVGPIYDAKRFCGARDILLLFYPCTLTEGEPVPLECEAVAWVEPARLPDYDWATADREVAMRLARERAL